MQVDIQDVTYIHEQVAYILEQEHNNDLGVMEMLRK